MLSAQPPDVVAATVGDAAAARLADELETSRRSGHVACSRNEFRPGVSAIAVAILDRAGRPVGSVAISGVRLEDELAVDSELARHLRRAAEVIADASP
jgi:DNA-binding IclR family transcriptional regulator